MHDYAKRFLLYQQYAGDDQCRTITLCANSYSDGCVLPSSVWFIALIHSSGLDRFRCSDASDVKLCIAHSASYVGLRTLYQPLRLLDNDT